VVKKPAENKGAQSSKSPRRFGTCFSIDEPALVPARPGSPRRPGNLLSGEKQNLTCGGLSGEGVMHAPAEATIREKKEKVPWTQRKFRCRRTGKARNPPSMSQGCSQIHWGKKKGLMELEYSGANKETGGSAEFFRRGFP